jgi:hypothetical protein
MKYKVFAPDSETIAGGWNRVGYVEAETEQEALAMAKKKHGETIMIRKVK